LPRLPNEAGLLRLASTAPAILKTPIGSGNRLAGIVKLIADTAGKQVNIRSVVGPVQQGEVRTVR